MCDNDSENKADDDTVGESGMKTLVVQASDDKSGIDLKSLVVHMTE